MPTFTFYLQDGGAIIPAFEIQLLDNDSAALAYGRKLLSERPRYSSVTIVEGDREVGEVARGAPANAAASDQGVGAS